jgi:hypothetical protein
MFRRRSFRLRLPDPDRARKQRLPPRVGRPAPRTCSGLAEDEAKRVVQRRRKLTEEPKREVTRPYAETTTTVSEIRSRFCIAESYRTACRGATEHRWRGGYLPPPNQSLRKHACPRRGPGAARLL